jgi:hypothetical protein
MGPIRAALVGWFSVAQLFNFIEVSRHRIGGWFRHVLGRSLQLRSRDTFTWSMAYGLGGKTKSFAPGAVRTSATCLTMVLQESLVSLAEVPQPGFSILNAELARPRFSSGPRAGPYRAEHASRPPIYPASL